MANVVHCFFVFFLFLVGWAASGRMIGRGNIQRCVSCAELAMLQSKFEHDRKRIQELRAQRKFKPY